MLLYFVFITVFSIYLFFLSRTPMTKTFDPQIYHICLFSLIFLPVYFSLPPEKKKKKFFSSFRAAPAAYGGSLARDQVVAVAASLHHSHSNTGSELRL